MSKTYEKINILVLGNSSVGKTSFILKYTENVFRASYLTTIGIDYKKKFINLNNKKYKIDFFDTAGQERYKSIALNIIKNADGILLLYDVTQQGTFDSISQWINDIENVKGEDAIIVLIGNKCDLTEDRKIDKEKGEELANKYRVSFFETSNKFGTNIETAALELINQIIKKNEKNIVNDFEIINKNDIIVLDRKNSQQVIKHKCNCKR